MCSRTTMHCRYCAVPLGGGCGKTACKMGIAGSLGSCRVQMEGEHFLRPCITRQMSDRVPHPMLLLVYRMCRRVDRRLCTHTCQSSGGSHTARHGLYCVKIASTELNSSRWRCASAERLHCKHISGESAARKGAEQEIRSAC